MAKKLFLSPVSIIATILVGLFLRLLVANHQLLFSHDQARDMFISQDILRGDLKLVGPSSDFPGVFHGPLYYYFLAPFSTNPAIASLAIILVNLFTLLPLYLLAKKMFKSRDLAIISIFLYATSFEAVNYGVWLSNPSLAIPAFAIYILGLWLLIEKDSRGWLLMATGLGIAIQAQLFMLYLLPVTGLFWLIYRPKLSWKILLITPFFFSFVVAEIKFGFQGISALSNFFYNQSQQINLLERVFNYLRSLESVTKNNLFPQNTFVAMLLLLPGLKKISRETFFLLFLITSHLLVYLVSKTTLSYIGLGMGIVFILLAVKAISLNKTLGVFIFLIICLSNILALPKIQPNIISLFKVQPKMSYQNEIAVVNKIYELANNEPFSISSAVNPYRTPSLWFYHFSRHQSPPTYHGLMAYDFAGKNALPISDKIFPVEFFIIEPGLDERLVQIEREIEDKRTKIVQRYYLNEFIIEKRKPLNSFVPLAIDQN